MSFCVIFEVALLPNSRTRATAAPIRSRNADLVEISTLLADTTAVSPG